MVKWRKIDKLMYIKYIIEFFLMAIGPHVFYSWNITKQMKTEKMIQCSFVKSPLLSYGNVFSFNFFFHEFIIKNAQKTHFWMEFHPKPFKF
jgi:hypothetical protein